MSILSECKMNSINPENILDIDPKTISFLTLIDGTILMVEQSAPVAQKQYIDNLYLIIKEQNFIIPNYKNKVSQNNIIYKNISFSINDNNNQKNYNKNNNIINHDTNNDIIDLSFNESKMIQINDFNDFDFNDSNTTLYKILFGFSKEKKNKRNNILKANNNKHYNTLNEIINNNKSEKKVNKNDKNYQKNENNKKYNSDNNSFIGEYIDKNNKLKNKKHFRQLIIEKENKRSIIKSSNIYSNKHLDILKPHINSEDDVSLKFNKLVNRLKINKNNKIYNYINYNNYNNYNNNINNNDIKNGNLKYSIGVNNKILSFNNSPNYSLRKNKYSNK